MGRPRIILADDHRLLVDGIRRLLEADFEVVETVNDGRAAVEAFERVRPDLILMDVGLPLLNGIEAARQIKALDPQARILFVSMHADPAYVEEAFRVGGSGYVLKQEAACELVAGIREVMRGRRYVSAIIGERSGITRPGERPSQMGGRLTQRQREVLQLIAEGKPMKEIGAILGISVRTVEFHKNGIMEELGIRSTAELVRYALSQGIAIP
jgi:DNA-binding NarL/FixJ family response regulator